ncbi:MAG TPA: photosynthetic complex putative assembly protein PuhB [Hyphomicrobiaceae bacterium]|nr:photosynthetic complex putative assembly protein PuhB [Hyphomicrobiaceae bacterium]
MTHDDFAHEPIRGLPERPPAGEEVLWQGAPHWPTLARRVMHIDLVAAYFLAIGAWKVANGVATGLPGTEIAVSLAAFAALSILAVGVLALLAWGIGRTTVYTITSRRVAMRFGIALPVTFNLPFSVINSAGVRDLGGGRGDLALELGAGQRIAFLVLWPHVRPWRLRTPEAMFRAVLYVARVSGILSTALKVELQRTGVRTVASSVRQGREPEAVISHQPIARPALTAAE